MTRATLVNHCTACGHRVQTLAPLKHCPRCHKPLSQASRVVVTRRDTWGGALLRSMPL